MTKLLRALAALILLWGIEPAAANFTITQGSGTTVVAVDAANQGTLACAAGSTECPATVLMDSTGTILSTTSHVLNVNSTVTNTVPVTGTFFQATQPVSLLSLPSLATGANVIGSISNSSFGISGTLPAFAATPTVNVGTFPALPTGANTIGAISNSSFGISGTLPAFASTPSFNLSQWGGTAITNIPTAVGTAGSGNTPTINAFIVGGAGGGGTSSNFSATFPTAGTAAGAEYLSAPPTLTSGQMVPFQTDVNGNLKVNVTVGGGTGGTSSSFGAAFPATGTAGGAEYLSAPPTFTSGNMVPFQTDVNGNLKVNVAVGGGTGGTSSSFGTAFPGTGTAAGAEYLSSPPALTSGQMVAFQVTSAGSLHVTADNTNPNGSAVSASSSPVVIASDQAAVATKAASGTYVAGSLVDITNITGSKAAGTAAANSILDGAVFNSTPITLTTGQQAALQSDTNGYLNVHIQAGAGSGGTASNFGAAFPTAGTAAGAEYLTSPPTLTTGQMVAFQTDINGNLKTNCVVGCIPLSAAGTTQTTAGAVQGVTGGVAVATNTGSWGGTAITNTPTTVGTAGTGTTPTINAYIVGGGGSGGTNSTFGAAFPSVGTAAGAEYLSSPPTFTSGNMTPLQTDVNGNLKITGSLSTSTFLSGGTYLNVNAVTTSANSVLPAGASIVVYNYGVVKAIVKLSTSGSTTVTAATADAIIGPGGAIELAVGSNTNIAYATTSQSAALQIVGGSGQWAGSTQNNLSVSQYNLASAIPSYATLIGGADTGNLMQVPSVNVAGTSGSEAFAVQGITSGVPIAGNINTWGGTAITNVPTAVGTVGTGNTPTVNAFIVGGAGSGGTALADNGAWTAGTTNMTIAGCEFTTGGATAITTAHAGAVGCTTTRAFFTDTTSVGGTALTAAVSALGTAATGTAVENVNTYIVGCVSTVCNANVTNAGTITAAAASASPVTNFNYVLNGTTWSQMAGDASGRAIVAGAGTAGTPTAGVLTVQGVASMTPVLVNPGTGASWGQGTIGSAPPTTAEYEAGISGGATGGLLAGTILANSSSSIAVGAATTVQVIALAASQKIYIMGFDFVSAGAGTVQLEYGTGTNCATGTTVLTGAYPVAANGGLSRSTGNGPALIIPAGDAFCVVTTASATAQGSVSYAQF